MTSFGLDNLSRDLLLLGGLQVSRVGGLLSHALHGVHHIALLREEGIAEVGRPLDVVAQAFDDVGQRGEPLNGRIPIFLLDGGGEGLALQVGVFGHPLLQLDDFERVRRGGKHLRQERIRIEGDRGHQRIELVIGNFRRR